MFTCGLYSWENDVHQVLVLGLDIYTFPIKSKPINKIKSNYDLIAMTPLQLANSINKIERIKNVIVGGGPVQNDLKRKILSLKKIEYLKLME